ncbi:radical SAM protein [Humisphaera borealis]|uniref:Radical SAM protein n=1 Tax=Humisphaera borealis TaxID=2807512 RepID=A0A7M2WXQ3_9BACT|nr:radical SAM protein [Humisphaera borealis]QOV90183.1 radical SAM protein [Humisphaera borealis]
MSIVQLKVLSTLLTLNEPQPQVDRSQPYPSCPWLEHGLAFNRRSVNACLIVHHGTGFPHLCDYNGGVLDLSAIASARARIIRENQGDGHAACRGCPHLVKRVWKAPSYPIALVAIAHFSHCNIECNYCFLQTADPAVFRDGFTPYLVLPALRQLSAARFLDPGATFDWGGGEPTIYREFDQILTFATLAGGTTWVHTNGTVMPRSIREGIATKRINILCSLDAGFPATWKTMKGKDLLPAVWQNLDEYVQAGCRAVLKYIMKEENFSALEIDQFLRRAAATGAHEVIVDIDYDYPNPSPAVRRGLIYLWKSALRMRFWVNLGATGVNFDPGASEWRNVHAELSKLADQPAFRQKIRAAYVRHLGKVLGRLLRVV